MKKGYSWSEQLGIAIAALVDAGQQELVDWTKDVSPVFFFGVWYEDVDVAIQILTVVSETRQATIDKVDVKPDVEFIEDLTHSGEQTELAKPGPSTEAMSQLTDWSRCFARDPIADTDEDFSDSLHE